MARRNWQQGLGSGHAPAPKIEALLDRQAPPMIAKVYRPSAAEVARNPNAAGAVTLWYP